MPDLLGNPQTLKIIADVAEDGPLPDGIGEIFARAVDRMQHEHRDEKAGTPLAQAPPDGRVVYRLALKRPDRDDSPVTYDLAAIPLDTGLMRDDACGAFTLRSDGTKGNVRSDGSDGQVAACWGAR